jgi:Ni,Fe-hydrogenase III small subunit/ferredoxin
MPWIPRGLRDGIVTTRYPRREDGYGGGFRGSIVVQAGHRDHPLVAAAADACPTEAITAGDGGPRLDRGRCILCGRCTERCPEVFRFDPGFATSTVLRSHLVVPALPEDDAAVADVRRRLASRVKALRRSVHVRHVDCGSDGSDEWEVAALTNPVYDVQRLGIYVTASPRHADLLLVTGVGAAGMLGPLKAAYEATPEPKVVVAAGVDAISGGLLGTGYAAHGGIGDAVPVDVVVPGSPPTPFGLLHGILVGIGRLPVGGRPAGRHRPGPGWRAAHGPASPEDPPAEAGP